MQNLGIFGLESDFLFNILQEISEKNSNSFIDYVLRITYPKIVLG